MLTVKGLIRSLHDNVILPFQQFIIDSPLHRFLFLVFTNRHFIVLVLIFTKYNLFG
jgi:hypothetical protein